MTITVDGRDSLRGQGARFVPTSIAPSCLVVLLKPVKVVTVGGQSSESNAAIVMRRIFQHQMGRYM